MRVQLLILASLLWAGSASAETIAPASPAPTTTETPATPVERPMVRNIGIAEQGDAIIVRNRKAEPASKPAEK